MVSHGEIEVEWLTSGTQPRGAYTHPQPESPKTIYVVSFFERNDVNCERNSGQLTRFITNIIDFFYPPFRKMMPPQTFRYIACGGGNTLLDILLYFISYNFILDKKILHLGFVSITPHIAAFIIAFIISFPSGFFLMRNIVFHDSNLKGRVQLFRYFLLVALCILLNYICLKLFVEQFHIYPTFSKILTTVIVVSFSYLTQKKFTFKVQA